MYGYVLQDPANLIDPSGNCPTCIIGAVVGGIVQGGLNAYQGYTGGARTDQIILSSFGGLAIGATTGAIGGATGLLGGTAAASIGAGLNNALNQAIYGNGSFNPSSMGQAALIGGAFGGIGATATASGFSSLLTPQGVGALSGVIGPLAGSSAASGIPNRCSK
ncbi:MAG: hypothetical protein Q7U04_14555 [Bacteriovorax sp.]|nr:hypothetical protein [Bacteriovorax sp.]